jgi:hypothetical protein
MNSSDVETCSTVTVSEELMQKRQLKIVISVGRRGTQISLLFGKKKRRMWLKAKQSKAVSLPVMVALGGRGGIAHTHF